MKKKIERSIRNRHTGRVNAYKQRILNSGALVKSSNGRMYRVISAFMRNQIVRDFAAERGLTL